MRADAYQMSLVGGGSLRSHVQRGRAWSGEVLEVPGPGGLNCVQCDPMHHR